MHTRAPLTELCFRYLLILRGVAIIGQLLALWLAMQFWDFHLPLLPIVLIVMSITVITIISWQRLRRGTADDERAILIQLCVDIAALGAMFYFTGGAFNPFVSLFLLPVTIAAAALQTRVAWSLAALAALAYTGLMFAHVHTFPWTHGHDHFDLHIWGMWFGFLFSAAMVTYFIARIGQTLRARNAELARLREQDLQSQQLLALGALAAGTAHELGTPLATMAVLLGELKNDYPADPLAGDLALLRAQVDQCKTALSRLSAQAGLAAASGGGSAPLDQYLTQLLARWQALKPEVAAELQLANTLPAPVIITDHTLTQALTNLLNNAAEAGARQLLLNARWDRAQLQLTLQDDGKGFSAAQLDPLAGQARNPQISAKPNNLGLGLYLTRATIARLGGSVHLANRQDARGAVVMLTLPLAGLRV